LTDAPGPQNLARLTSPSALRNREAILEVLRGHLPAAGRVLEIASGTGEHVACFAEAIPALQFQPSDPEPARRASIDSWTSGLLNVLPALDLDVTGLWPAVRVDAVLCINMIHIAAWAAAEALFAGASKTLLPNGRLILYGPFKTGVAHTAPSNANFDADLRSRNPKWGVRDLTEVCVLAARFGFALPERIDMPANNLCLIFCLEA
jgi:cyclopropane fatty-acyl-phospholipid synthase-like methyltransferase